MHSRRADRIREGGVVAILRGVDPDAAIDVADAVVDGGVTALEVTADTPAVTETIGALADRFDDVLVGAGTVLDAETARAVQLAGAQFLVTPTVDAGVIETANRYGTPVATGAFTPTEALRASEAGADFVKVFPAATGGPEHVAALGGPLPQIPLVPTGGVGPANAGDYVEAGAVAVGVGSAIVDDDAVANGEFERIAENARRTVDAVAAARER
ncbi:MULTISPECIES: bifunctional 4-hydroxy-2-oxoglutarate aldolase/2-dehydro-3-deoxy-phosphogluconate aldolase [unclassified Halorubrum]|uniref:bifunctional 4-hydroxy-2-oxoglutarate aldolase/2-dehydro-3-deoxy-phosphogluconate aldolase n=1 Tax=unclassified Halorubrum TaxID=2642239 RepID=UPI000B97F8B6|nr:MULTISPECIES: bifunctional 4-hydroxy-2-oxoglutarate aldolase/2-dehydro-3-deoxy-phosphogluconate aldolase [unclassified Halorubrum]OYR47602.1 2-dehydro-3-deoxyphosphogluconate aldolase [Halorubrum sp. Hd13]OYR49275.1 2-dehydro-3-deoxyphosphogluconate aldolase [Halorubrum sp. Eb13]OYR51700.1 2-dehydro-3-deoxyphosphogluconate aldolase [Halorubrum sp. Ea8]OYR51883.1 2-dehydro-3-deoxyphosphogluconate aldolase [Halorubrum sp. Ea1]